jgi:hypothetical protein
MFPRANISTANVVGQMASSCSRNVSEASLSFRASLGGLRNANHTRPITAQPVLTACGLPVEDVGSSNLYTYHSRPIEMILDCVLRRRIVWPPWSPCSGKAATNVFSRFLEYDA